MQSRVSAWYYPFYLLSTTDICPYHAMVLDGFFKLSYSKSWSIHGLVAMDLCDLFICTPTTPCNKPPITYKCQVNIPFPEG
jgi:hypothetical protein